jgi:hypothetical protein
MTHNGRSVRSIREVVEENLLQTDPSLSYEEILIRVKEEFPECKTSNSSLRWYASKMLERGERLPRRPRANTRMGRED